MLEILKRNKRIEIENLLEKNYGIKIPFKYHLIKAGKDKIRIFTGNLPAQDLRIMNKLLTIDIIGMYFAFFKDQKLRLSFDSTTIFGKAAKNIIDLSDIEARKWLKGQDLDKDIGIRGYILLRYDSNILGCGKSTGKKILNFVPKERRIL
ncbi:MAG: hypothetical protein IB618_01805 [Candidatus Pacearchaeota archaeon]|nr:MAG: hypothetical protein IB618_01805 [Candidatus Pacearchaeota archaeon]